MRFLKYSTEEMGAMNSALHEYRQDGRPGRRNWQELMKSNRLAAMQPSRLSGTRSFMAKMIRERWDIKVARFDVDDSATGTVVYSIKAPSMEFSLIAFSFTPKREGRTGRIIGRAWDMMCTLNEGPVTEEDIESARENLPKLYRGRASPNSLIWGRSNRSMRTFNATLEALSQGKQPKTQDINSVCYLMRNTGLDGNGTFGTRSFPSLGPDHPLGGILEAQLLTGYLMREFSCDLVEHLARLASDKAVPLDPEFRRYIGVGNGSALGLIFFVQRHPRLVNAWLDAHESAIAQACGLALRKGDARIDQLIDLVDRVIVFRQQDQMYYECATSSQKVAEELGTLLPALRELRDEGTVDGQVRDFPLDYLARRSEVMLAPESYESFLSLIIELVADYADELFRSLQGRDELRIDPSATVGELKSLIESEYAWALTIDMSDPAAQTYVWYKSQSAEEPRRGPRIEIPNARSLGLDLPGDLQSLMNDISHEDAILKISRFVLKHPQHRFVIARVQSLKGTHFHTPHANVNAMDFVPIDFVRLMNVGIHGIDKTRDFLQRNLRGVLYHGAPTRNDIRAGRGADWFFPMEPNS